MQGTGQWAAGEIDRLQQQNYNTLKTQLGSPPKQTAACF
jgi:hypothetical protein